MTWLKPFVLTAPAVKPLSLDEVKSHCRIDHGDDDALITFLIDAAVANLDGYHGRLGRAMINQTWVMRGDGFCDRIELPVDPLVSITNVKYFDADNNEQTLAASVYATNNGDDWPYITLKAGQSWPPVFGRDDAVTVTWVAGHGAAAADVPASIRQAMLLLVGHWYQNREAVSIGDDVHALPFAVDALLGPRRRIGV